MEIAPGQIAGIGGADARRGRANTLVIVVTNDAPTMPKSAADLAKPEIKKLALAEPGTVPAGITRESISKISGSGTP